MRDYRTSKLFEKHTKHLKGKPLRNLLNKIEEILTNDSIDHYKNLSYEFKIYKRAHVNKSYVILFYCKDNTVFFVDYQHHDKIYKKT